MIVVDKGDNLLVITQPDHARMAADLLSLWIRDDLPRWARRDQLLFAVREHDNGWREVDAAPRASSSTGRPHDFLSIPDDTRREIWLRATARFQRTKPYESLLILWHARELNRRKRGEAPWEEFFASLDQRAEELLERVDASRQDLGADHRFLRLADSLSLVACRQAPGALRVGSYDARFSAGELSLAPFPLAGATTLRLPCRRIPHRRYRGDADLGGELAAARWVETAIRVIPPPTRVGCGRRDS